MTDIIVKDIKNGSEYYYGWSAEVSAEDVSYDNSSSWAVANNIQDAMDEVFQSVSNGKGLIADAITDKWVSTSATDSFQTMATNIGLIQTATDEQIAAYNLVHSSWSLLFSLAWGSDAGSDWQQLILANWIWWTNFEYYFVWLTTMYNSFVKCNCSTYQFNNDCTYTNKNINIEFQVNDSYWSYVSDLVNMLENRYIVSDERYRYAFRRTWDDSYSSILKFDIQTWNLTQDTSVTVSNSQRTLSNIKTTLPYNLTSNTVRLSVSSHVYNILATV